LPPFWCTAEPSSSKTGLSRKRSKHATRREIGERMPEAAATIREDERPGIVSRR